ncbi:uncharacterized protein [Anabrus simplex]|uniref:uncharacterized protein n=1 Tax=Anabrus simplex TaxID=316456 RepID=UPI0035A2C1E0
MQTYHIFLLSVFISAASSFKTVDVPEQPVDTRTWPYRLYLQSVEITINENYGSSKTQVRKDKSDNLRKLSGYVQVDKQVDCTVKGSMVTMIKNNNQWVENYRLLPKPFDAFMKEMQAPMDSISAHSGMSTKCPLEPGNYTFDKYVMEAEAFPRDIQLGEYLTTTEYTVGVEQIAKFVFSTVLDPIV